MICICHKATFNTFASIILLLLTLNSSSIPVQAEEENVWVLTEILNPSGDKWHELFRYGDSYSRSLVDLDNGSITYHFYKTSNPSSSSTYDYKTRVNFDSPPKILIPGETVSLNFRWSIIDGAGGKSYPRGSSFYLTTNDLYYPKPVPFAGVYYTENDESTAKSTLIFQVVNLSNKEFKIVLYHGGGSAELDLRVEWIYRAGKERVPIIFVPGVAGSVLKEDIAQLSQLGFKDPELWPISETDRSRLELTDAGDSKYKIYASDIIRYVAGEPVYGPFIEEVESWGYEEGTDLFTFPYDWRQDNYLHADALKAKIDEALESTKQKKVILIAHSMGGIVARAYMQKHGTENIDTFITMGTPHQGSIKPYYALTMGYTFGNPTVNKNLMKIILQNSPSAYQLLPWETFIEEEKTNDYWTLDESFSVKYHSTEFQKINWFGYDVYKTSLDWPWSLKPDLLEKAEEFRGKIGTKAPDGVKTYTIIGYGRATLNKFLAFPPGIYDPDLPAIKPRNYGVQKLDGEVRNLAPEFGEGDGTVPLWSAQSLQNDKKFYIKDLPNDSAEHGSLPLNNRVQNLIKQLIFENADSSIYQTIDNGELNEADTFDFYIHSSANLHIYDSNGNHMGVNEYGAFEESIPGGSFLELNGLEYCSIRNPSDQYTLEVKGFEEGTFTLGVTVKSDKKTVEILYPEVKVVNGTTALLSLLSINSTIDNPPSLKVENQNDIYRINPVVREVSNIKATEHQICKKINNKNEPENIASVFTPNDSVNSWLKIIDASLGDQVHWVFKGPNSRVINQTYIFNWAGEGSSWATLNLNDYVKNSVVGEWDVTVFLNGKKIYENSVEVRESSQSIPGYPIEVFMLGLLLAILINYICRPVNFTAKWEKMASRTFSILSGL